MKRNNINVFMYKYIPLPSDAAKIPRINNVSTQYLFQLILNSTSGTLIIACFIFLLFEP